MAAEPGPWRAERAPAKVNLYLHLTGQRPDGYHLLESLAVFPATGDVVHGAPAEELSLEIRGRFAAGLSTGPDNLVLAAAEALRRRTGVTAGAALVLEKNLPVASGIGGGSSDAAAVLRLLAGLWGCEVPHELALTLGADVPVCLTAPRPMLMGGIGEHLLECPAMPGFWMVLVNPLIAVETRAVFANTMHKTNPPPLAPPETGFADFESLVAWLSRQRNDLTEGALALCPEVGAVLAQLDDAALARMSGSGASCFGLYADQAAAETAAARIAGDNPGWWIAAAPV